MPQLETIDFDRVVDLLLADFVRANIPPVPSIIADTLAAVFYQGTPEPELTQYRSDLQEFVRARLELLVRESQETCWLAWHKGMTPIFQF